MTEKALHKVKLVYYTLEHLLGPVLVFLTCYLHHLYFADDFVSSFFAGFSLVSLLMVMALEKLGLICAAFVQLVFLGWVALAGPQELMQQILFSASLAISLVATYINLDAKEETVPTVPQAVEQKDKLWQELFDARQEIKDLYQQKQELAASFEDKLLHACREREEKILFMQHHLEAIMLDKAQLIEAKDACEEDIKKLIDNMHEMALRLEQSKQQKVAPQVASTTDVSEPEVASEDKKQAPYEAMYRQLKMQFAEKSEMLNQTRKELFSLQDQQERLLRQLQEPSGPTEEEKELMKQLAKADKRLESLKKKHSEELIGYEEVIKGLLAQLQEKAN